MSAYLFDLFGTIVRRRGEEFVVDDDAVSYVLQLLDSDQACGIIATCPAAVTSALRANLPLIDECDVAVFSSDIGVGLPDARALAVAASAMGHRIPAMVFYSADAENLAAAAEAGMDSREWV